MKYLGRKLDIHPSAYRPPPMLWKKWSSTGKVKPQSWEFLQNIFSSVSELSQLQRHRHLLSRSRATILPLVSGTHFLTKIVISVVVRTFTSFLDFTYSMGWRAISQCRVCNILRQKQHYAGQKVLRFLILILYSVIAELTRVVKGVVTMSEIKGKESGQPVYACALNARTLDWRQMGLKQSLFGSHQEQRREHGVW